MLLKRMDETIQAGLYDIIDESPNARVYLIEPYLNSEEILSDEVMQNLSSKEQERKRPKVHWKEVDHGEVPKTVLHYDDTNDTSNKFLRSYQDFYSHQADFGKRIVYSGSSSIFKNGTATFGGTAKAVIYLRYSTGFINFLKEFDIEAAAILEVERPLIRNYFQCSDGCRFPTVWNDFKSKNAGGDWPLAAICRCSDGSYIVPFLKAGASREDYEELEELGIDVEHSLKLMEYFTSPSGASKDTQRAGTQRREVIESRLQMGSGLGRNPFGRESDSKDSDSEYLRLKGIIPESERTKLLKLLAHPASYKINVAPNPDTSELWFLPEKQSGEKKQMYSALQEFINAENEQKKLWFEAKKNKTAKLEDVEALPVHPADYIPAYSYSTVFMVNTEGAQQKKLIIQKIFPSVELTFFTRLNDELLNSGLQYSLLRYMSTAMTGQESGKTPAIYQYWTEIFSKALQKQFISGLELYNRFQQFAKGQSGEKLIGDESAHKRGSAPSYFWIIGKMLRLQHLIAVARENPETLGSTELKQTLEKIEHFEQQPMKGVFVTMADRDMSMDTILGENTALLRENERRKLERFIQLSAGNVPDDDFNIFIRGALTGILLNELCWTVNQQGRRFSATQGRQVSRLRGCELTKIFVKGVGLLQNLGCPNLFNCQMLPFIKSGENESRRDAFNNGLIMGMTFIDKKENNNTEEVTK